ncbi:transmembrane protease serine 9-like [Micropterus dolomieu]|uniref:transmembrane protease serine 9-like n=1 Tax=Micropterus dolomieu TaxID=147949 RepID=UPI001E8E5665|nr:transmembrane protease serine 9-like [Micropterus dolomieu]
MQGLNKLLFFHVLTCLGQNALGGKIIDGDRAPENLMLYMASLQNIRGHVCGGFLISEDFVVSAAHCDCLNPSSVVLGTHNLKSARTERSIEKKCIPPSYENVGGGNDIMLLKLSSAVQLNERVQLIQLPKTEISMKDGEKCSVAGWGKTETGGAVVDDLRVVEVSVINPQVCKMKWQNLPANVLCAGGYDTKKGFCQGDSGGPLLCNGMAVGIVSFNRNYTCNYPDVPNVYTDISKYLPWINKILKEKNCFLWPQCRTTWVMYVEDSSSVKTLWSLLRTVTATLGGKIIHGEKVPENSMLYMVSLQNIRGHVCGGFLIREDFVVSAAHCDHVNPTHVVLGSHNLKAENTVRSIEKKYKPTSYENVGTGNDIMLLKLSSAVQLNERVQLTQLPKTEISMKDGEKCSVSGWGMTETGGAVVDDLRVVDVSVINLEDCKEKWMKLGHLPANVLCAGGYDTKKGFCQGDSGGPLVCNGTAVGIVSFNKDSNCNYPDVPNVYTDISKYLPWINKILKENNCSK